MDFCPFKSPETTKTVPTEADSSSIITLHTKVCHRSTGRQNFHSIITAVTQMLFPRARNLVRDETATTDPTNRHADRRHWWDGYSSESLSGRAQSGPSPAASTSHTARTPGAKPAARTQVKAGAMASPGTRNVDFHASRSAESRTPPTPLLRESDAPCVCHTSSARGRRTCARPVDVHGMCVTAPAWAKECTHSDDARWAPTSVVHSSS